MDDFILEKELRETLKNKSRHVCEDGLAGRRIRENVYARIGEEKKMRRKSWTKVAVAAAAICLFGSITAMALGRASFIVGHSSVNESVTDYNEAAALLADLNKAAKSVESFSNGYTFKSATPVYMEAQDENQQAIGEETAVSFVYGKEGMPDIEVMADRIEMTGELSEPDATLTLEDGTTLEYKKIQNKFVPPDYEITEEEKKLQDEGKLNVGYGSDEIEEVVSSNVTWKQNGLNYSMFLFGEEPGADELLGMAKELAGK